MHLHYRTPNAQCYAPPLAQCLLINAMNEIRALNELGVGLFRAKLIIRTFAQPSEHLILWLGHAN